VGIMGQFWVGCGSFVAEATAVRIRVVSSWIIEATSSPTVTPRREATWLKQARFRSGSLDRSTVTIGEAVAGMAIR
jgi:hypothetical protein